MGSYKNNKDGTNAVISTNIQVVDAPMEEFLSRGEFNAITPNDVGTQNKLVAENEVTKAFDTMPTASEDLVGTIVQYVGTTTANYTNGYFYRCVSDGAVTPTYSWVEVISGGDYTAGRGIDITNKVLSTNDFEITGKYNVLDYGLVGDNTFDNTTMLQSLINTVPSGAVIYFPQGFYVIQNQIVIPANKYILFLGDTVACRHKNTKNANYPESAIVIGNSFPTNTTAFVIQDGVYARMLFKGLSFYANELYKITENTATYSTLPYSYFKVVNSANSEDNPQNLTRKVNCIAYPYCIEDCIFEGFSGYAIKIKVHRFVTNCTFLNCYIGIQASDTDCVIDKCWFNQGYIGVYLNNENANYMAASINNCWCDAMSGHFVYGNNTSNNTLLINDAWVDMIDKSAVYVPNGYINHGMINGRFSRCGMMYAGIEESQVTSEIRQSADVIVAKKFYNSELDIICDKRAIGGIGATKDNICPHKLLYGITGGSSNFNNTRVVTDMSDAEIGYENANIEVHTLSGEDIERYKIYSYDMAKIHFRSNSPIGIVQAARPNMLAFDTVNKRWYRSTAANDNTAWVDITMGITHYTIMPSTADLLTLPNNTVFETDGYWAQKDGHGGKYLISSYQQGGCLTVTDGTTTKYLFALDNNGNMSKNYVDPTRFGIRAIDDINGTLTLQNTYAEANSSIMSSIVNADMNATIRFPKGKFVFASPLDLSGRQYNLVGDSAPIPRTSALSYTSYDIGTLLCFPFLSNGQVAITMGAGNVENIAIYGNKDTYNITFDRTKAISAPNEVITETIATDSGTQIKCTGLSKSSIGVIQNVYVFCFYKGMRLESSIYAFNIYCRKCHIGIEAHNDTKFMGVYGYDVYQLMYVNSHMTSVNQLRVDSCFNAMFLNLANKCTFVDIDGDWCADSLIKTIDVSYCVFEGIHGRCCTLKSYDSEVLVNGYDIRTIDNTDGYGIIRAVKLKNSRIVFNNGASKCFDNAQQGDLKYYVPNIIFTFPKGNNNVEVSDNQFVINNTVVSADDILKVIQTKADVTIRVDTSSGTYYVEGTTAQEDNPSTDIDFSTLFGGD